MYNKCMKSCLKLGFVWFYCMVFIQLMKRFWWIKDEDKVATIKNNSLGTVEKYHWSTCSVSSCCHQQGLQLQFPWTAVVANGSKCSGSLPSLLQHQYPLFLASFAGGEGWWVMQLTLSRVFCAFLHPLAKTRWVLISLNFKKLFQHGEETAQRSAALLASQDCSKCTEAVPECSACLSLL